MRDYGTRNDLADYRGRCAAVAAGRCPLHRRYDDRRDDGGNDDDGHQPGRVGRSASHSGAGRPRGLHRLLYLTGGFSLHQGPPRPKMKASQGNRQHRQTRQLGRAQLPEDDDTVAAKGFQEKPASGSHGEPSQKEETRKGKHAPEPPHNEKPDEDPLGGCQSAGVQGEEAQGVIGVDRKVTQGINESSTDDARDQAVEHEVVERRARHFAPRRLPVDQGGPHPNAHQEEQAGKTERQWSELKDGEHQSSRRRSSTAVWMVVSLIGPPRTTFRMMPSRSMKNVVGSARKR